jgi:uncharacterized protein involved in exopolysaccharide biosynthesis
VTFLAAITGVVVSLITPATYVSRTSIMPSQQSGGGGSGLASLGTLAGLAGLGPLSNMAAGIKSSDEMFIALMRSQSVQTSLIEQFKLKERYGAKNTEEARQALNLNVSVLADKKSGLLLIDAQDKDPEFAAQLANAQVKELNVILSRLAVTEAQQRRAYYEQQIIKTQTKIPQLELEYKEAQKSSGLEVASLLSEAGTLPGQIAAKELQLQVLSRFATAQNPELKRLAVEISALRAQMARYELSKTEPKSSEPSKPRQLEESTKANFVQKATQAYNTLKIQEALLDGYVKQLELAKVDEAKEGPAVQVVDEARAPEMRAKPERKKIVIAYTVTGSVIAFVFAALRALLRHIRSTPDGLQRWSQLKRAWGFA